MGTVTKKLNTVTKKQLIERVAQHAGVKRTVSKKVVQAFLDEMIAELRAGHRLEFRDFGVFEVKERKARQAQNPKTMERVHVPPKRTVRFKIGRAMRNGVENGVLEPSRVEVKNESRGRSPAKT